MKILVPIKRVPDYGSVLKVNNEGDWIVEDDIKWIVNPFDEIAVEEALRIKEKGEASEVVVVTIGSSEASLQLRHTMAMGADRGILVETSKRLGSEVVARVLHEIVTKEIPSLILMGKQAIDTDRNQTGQMLAARLSYPQACFASKIEMSEQECKVTREIDGGLETVRLSLPALVTTDLRLNEPRYASLPGIMKAKKKPLDVISLESLGVDTTPLARIVRVSTPPKRGMGRRASSVDELVDVIVKYF
jgi:electron transfer flavoprotein beta subunit